MCSAKFDQFLCLKNCQEEKTQNAEKKLCYRSQKTKTE